MKRLWLILFVIFSLNPSVFGQDEYPYFSDPSKQLEFEKNRIYIIEEKGTNPITFGGGSTTELANPIQSIFGGEEPQYVAKHNPLHTYNISYHNFKIEKNGIEISEIDLLSLLGLEEEKNRILKHYQGKITQYEEEFERIRQEPTKYINEQRINKDWFAEDLFYTGIVSFCLCGGPGIIAAAAGSLDDSDAFFTKFLLTIGLIGGGMSIAIGEMRVKTEIPKQYPNKPVLSRQMSTNQIKSLAITYNQNLYKNIAGK